IADGGLEGRAVPELEGLRRLNIVMAVGKNRWRPVPRPAPFADDDRMPCRRMHSRLEARIAHRSRDPFGGARRIGVMLGARADARNAQEVEELVADAAIVRAEKVVEIGGNGHESRFEVRGCSSNVRFTAES